MSSVIHAIPVVGPGAVGVHLLWNGPREWIYSPGGWRLQRRELDRRRDVECVTIGGATLTALRDARELRTAIGLALLRGGSWPESAVVGAPAGGSTAEVITLELDRPAAFVRVISSAKWNFIVALRHGKVVGGGTVQKAPVTVEFAAPGIDTIVAYTQGLGEVLFCRGRDQTDESWREAPVIARLQLPLGELMPELTDFDAELALARSRLLPGETLLEEEFREVADLLRLMVRSARPPRAIDLALVMRETLDDELDELAALDPLRSLLLVPRWRRVLGFAYVDADPALVPGNAYEYHLTGAFPADETTDRVVGFHTVPSTTALPADFSLDDVRVRLAQPATVARTDVAASATRAIARRGVTLREPIERFWVGIDLETESAVIDFPVPVSAVVLELAGTHALSFAAGQPWDIFGAYSPVPAGSTPRLTFAIPCHQLRLKGTGFLCAVRVDGGGGSALVEDSVSTSPVTLVDSPLPAAPPSLDVSNLQAPRTTATTDLPENPTLPAHALGFELGWTPAALANVNGWPPDLNASPPLDATMFQIEHQPIAPPGAPWVPVLEDDNLATGDRALPSEPVRIIPGGDLMQVFPEARPPQADAGAVRLVWRDVFDFEVEDTPVRRPLPATGTLHRYRIRAVDAIGRPSPTWTESSAIRLEKHNPPPLPVGPDPRPAHALDRAAPSGPQVRVIDRNASDFSPDDRALLGSHANAIVLSWGWHEEQRRQDPSVTEFRVYASRHRLDARRARIDAVTEIGAGKYVVDVHLDRAVVADASGGLVLDAGYPFHLRTHGAGQDIQATVAARVALPDGTFPRPALGPCLFPMRLTPDATRAPAWDSRVQIVPLVADRSAYEASPIFDLLDLSPDHPRDEALVGVSAADAEPYVTDPLAPMSSRPGNEGAIAVVTVAARYRGRPVVEDVPALAPVPAIVTPFPGARPLSLRLDVTPILGGSGFVTGQQAVPERALADEVFRAYRVEADRLIARVIDPRVDGDAEREVVIPNPIDRATVLGAFASGEIERLSDAHVVFLSASHPFGARLFTPVSPAPIIVPTFDDTLPNRAARVVYRLRAVDAAGRTSFNGVTLKGILRIPATGALAAPLREASRPGDPKHRLRLAVRGDTEVTHVMVFSHVHPTRVRAPLIVDLMWRSLPAAPSAVAARVRLPDGTLLVPTLKSLADADVEGTAPYRALAIDATIGGDDRVSLWACSVTRDGWLSPLVGPWTL
jgi:hypothetical protein